MSYQPPPINHRPKDRTAIWIALGIVALFFAASIGWIANSLLNGPGREVASSGKSVEDTAKTTASGESQTGDSNASETELKKSSSNEDFQSGSESPLTKKQFLSKETQPSPNGTLTDEDLTQKIAGGPPKLSGLPSFKNNPAAKRPASKRSGIPVTEKGFGPSKTEKRIVGTPEKNAGKPQTPSKKPDAAKPSKAVNDGAKNQYALPQATTDLTIYQDLTVQRNPSFAMEGISELKQSLKYRTVSQMMIGPADKNGFRKVIQKIVDAKLLDSDAISAKSFGKSVKELVGKQFTFTLDRKQKILDFKGEKDKVKTFDLKDLESIKGFTGEGMMMSSVMDLDGWKEMAQLTFLLPEDKKKQWTDQMGHDWGELGKWSGETRFEKKGVTNKLLRIDYAHWMTYLPGDLSKSKLPFKLERANFESTEAGGRIFFDTKKGRIDSLIERFRVNGKMEASLLGTSTSINLSEVQSFELKLHDQNPQ